MVKTPRCQRKIISQVITQNLALLDQTLNKTGISKASGHPAHLPEATRGQIKISSFERNGELGTARDLLSSKCRSNLVVINIRSLSLGTRTVSRELYRRHSPGNIALARDKPALLTISSKRDQQ